MTTNISGNFNTSLTEVAIVKKILSQEGISYLSVYKSPYSDDEDVAVNFSDGSSITIEVKEEKLERINKYNDLGIDYISAFYFISANDEFCWKGSPKSPTALNNFESKINIQKLGKIFYSKAELWLFYCLNIDGTISFAEWYLGSDMTSANFIQYLRLNCSFSVNNKTTSQLSHSDSHQSAVFFINRNDPYLLTLKKDIKDLLNR